MFVVQFFKCASFTCLVQDNQTDKQRIQTFFLFIQILSLFIT